MSDRPYYLALGDNLSIDLFAGGPGHGAASLLYRDNGVFEEFAGLDLRSRIPDLAHVNLARDGAVAAAVAMDQAFQVEEIAGDIRVVTLTVGINDFIRNWGCALQTGEIAGEELGLHVGEILGDVRRTAGDEALILVGNIFDPTDGTGDYEAFGTRDWPDGHLVLDLFNRILEDVSDEHDALIADLHGHFLGHGFAVDDPTHPHHDPDDPTSWYIQRSEANDRGASEIRRLFWKRVEEMFPAAS